MRRSVLCAVAGAATIAVALTGCGGASHPHTSVGTPSLVPGGAPHAVDAGGNAGYGAVASTSLSGGVTDTVAGAGGGGAVNGKSILLGDNRSVIRRAELTVGVKKASDVARQANKAEEIVGALGGDVFGDDRQSGVDATATLILKVPPASLIKALAQLSALGNEQDRSLSSQDVTTQVADVNARVASAQASIARLRTLYAHATKVADVIEIEQELAARQSDLESLQGQQKALANETQMATISFVLTTQKAPAAPAKKHHRHGIGGAFARGWDHFVSAGSWVISAIAAVGPWAVLVALLAFVWIRRRRVSPAPAPSPDPAPAG